MSPQKRLSLSSVVAISSEGAQHNLQANSDRRAVLTAIIDAGGRCSVADLNARFGFDVRTIANGLMRRGWIKEVPL